MARGFHYRPFGLARLGHIGARRNGGEGGGPTPEQVTRPAWLPIPGPRREKEGFGQGDTSLRSATGILESRCGELLREIEPKRGANQNIGAGGDPKVTRKRAATNAGMSERQRKTALRVANVPEGEFETAVEAGSPFPGWVRRSRLPQPPNPARWGARRRFARGGVRPGRLNCFISLGFGRVQE